MSAVLPPALSIHALRHGYGTRAVLHGIDLTIPTGAYCALTGVNGAGKTTLLKCVLDFIRADAGEIRIQGIDSRQTLARDALVFVPERFSPPYYLTGSDFLHMSAALMARRTGVQDAKDRLRALEFDLSALPRSVRTYSKGMTQKLGLAVALASTRALLVLDEPMSGLDPLARLLVKRELRGLRNSDRTIFFTSHSLADVTELADQMAVLHAGHLRYAGRTDDFPAQFGADNHETAFLNCIA